jgi:hypothetical protein
MKKEEEEHEEKERAEAKGIRGKAHRNDKWVTKDEKGRGKESHKG